MEQQKKVVSGAFLRQSMHQIKKLNHGSFSTEKYYKIDDLWEEAACLFDLYEDNLLTVKEKDQKTFALYIKQFGNARREALLDKLQAESKFDVRNYLQKSSVSFWQKLFGKNNPDDLSQKKMKRAIKKFQKLQKRASTSDFYSFKLSEQIESLAKEAEKYITAYNEGSYTPKSQDMSTFDAYIKTMGFFYTDSPAERALTKLQQDMQQLQTQKEKHTHAVAVPFKKSWSRRLKYAAAGVLAVVGSVFGMKSGSGDHPIPLTSPSQPQAKVVKLPDFSKFSESKPTDFVLDSWKQTSFQDQITDTVKATAVSDHQKEWDNFYTNRLTGFTSKSRANKLIETMQNQLDNGIIKLPHDISSVHYLYAQQIYRKYGFKKIADEMGEILTSKQPLSSEKQDKLYLYVRQAGSKGVGVQKMAQQYQRDILQQLSKRHQRSIA